LYNGIFLKIWIDQNYPIKTLVININTIAWNVIPCIVGTPAGVTKVKPNRPANICVMLKRKGDANAKNKTPAINEYIHFSPNIYL
jgi:hypothetical protein